MPKLPAPCRCGHHPRLRPRRISPAARLPSNRGFGGLPRSLSVLLLDGNAEVIPAELARGVGHRAPNQLISTRRHSAECCSPPHSARPLFINSGLCIPKAQPTRAPPIRSPSPADVRGTFHLPPACHPIGGSGASPGRCPFCSSTAMPRHPPNWHRVSDTQCQNNSSPPAEILQNVGANPAAPLAVVRLLSHQGYGDVLLPRLWSADEVAVRPNWNRLG